MLTCWPMAAAPVAIMKAASTRSRSPEKTTSATRSSATLPSTWASRFSRSRSFSSRASMRDQFHVLGDLGPALKVRYRASIRCHHLEHLAKLDLPNFLARVDQRHGAVEAAGVEKFVKSLAHCLPPPEAA